MALGQPAFPGQPDLAGDGVDQSCDGVDGMDRDGDGHASWPSGGDDCDDADAAVSPSAPEVWYDGLDQDCDRGCDGDQDGDGYVLDGWAVLDGDACDTDPSGAAFAPTDCDDSDPLAAPLLLSTSPVDGALDVSPSREVRATLWAADPSATLALADAAGGYVPGTVSWAYSTLVFTPDTALAPLTTYDATFTWGCGVETWSFTTSDGTRQEILHQWFMGSPDILAVDVLNPVATQYQLGLAETAAGSLGWYGEDCAGSMGWGPCHPMTGPTLLLDSVFPYLGSVVPGATTLFDASFDTAITYYLEAMDGPQQGTCWTWGHDPAYYPGCTAI